MQTQAAYSAGNRECAVALGPPLLVEGLRRLGCDIVASTGFTAQLSVLTSRVLPALVLVYTDGRDAEGLLGALRHVRTVQSAARIVVLSPPQPSTDLVESFSALGCEIVAQDIDTVTLQLLLGVGVAAPQLLTRREIDVLTLAAEGLSNHAIGRRLGLQMNTVKNYLRSVHRKLGARSRTEAVMIAARAGYPVLAGSTLLMPPASR